MNCNTFTNHAIDNTYQNTFPNYILKTIQSNPKYIIEIQIPPDPNTV